MSEQSTAEQLAECIISALSPDTQDFQWDVFFRLWFRERGTPAFFLFKRHLGVTNAQYVELLALLRTHTTVVADGRRPDDLLFHTTEHVKTTVIDAVNSLIEASGDRRQQALSFATQYADIFESTVAVDMFYCSCAVFFPPGLRVNLTEVCGSAGYLHSVGTSVYVRNIKKAKQKDFENGIRAHLSSLPNSVLPLPFVVYAHEDFSQHDKDAKEQIGRGIEHTKLHVEKMSMGSYRLSQVVQDMRKIFDGKLVIPEPGPYTQKHAFTTTQTLWLIADRSVDEFNPVVPGKDRYYICYLQSEKNENPFFFFDENKPAWKSHTTLPHSLTAALINATGPHEHEPVLCDPFGGTGTTWLEAKRLNVEMRIHCSDLSPAASLMARDNLQFFLAEAPDLRLLRDRLSEIEEEVKRSGSSVAGEERQSSLEFGTAPYAESSSAGAYLYAVSLLHELRVEQPTEDQEFQLSEAFVGKLARMTTWSRLLFYIALRAELRYQGGFKRKSVTFEKAFLSSLRELIEQTSQLLEVRELMVTGRVAESGNWLKYPGHYSEVVVPRLFGLRFQDMVDAVRDEISVRDARELKPASVDVIICDPPYGFNTTEDQEALATLYSEFIDAAIRALKNKGQLIICLPAESYTGRDLPYCTRSGLIKNQVLVKARAQGKEAVVPARSLPSKVLQAPYYWEAERALRRVLLHFHIHDRPELLRS